MAAAIAMVAARSLKRRRTLRSRVYIAAGLIAMISYPLHVHWLFRQEELGNSDTETSISKDRETPTDIVVVQTKLKPDQCQSESRGHFDQIYTRGEWGTKYRSATAFYGNASNKISKERIESASGLGSNLGPMTVNSLKLIRDAIVKYNVTTVIDIPCGDVNWILDSFETDTLHLYVGLDIASGPILVNSQRFGHHSNKQFHFWDASECVLPKLINSNGETEPFDLVHVRDVIQHMPLERGVQFFCNVFKAGPRVLVTTTYPGGSNRNIDEGKWYRNNLKADPFSFPDVPCERSHLVLSEEDDETCVFDLVKENEWVEKYLETKCSV
mmetsp:Transcript_29052/g.69207  ORF Transcript_29052/g.69207 Transcript_29052/m.69207 type:complete len:327 (-) Transcript_29052:134-1114(-)